MLAKHSAVTATSSLSRAKCDLILHSFSLGVVLGGFRRQCVRT